MLAHKQIKKKQLSGRNNQEELVRSFISALRWDRAWNSDGARQHHGWAVTE